MNYSFFNFKDFILKTKEKSAIHVKTTFLQLQG